MFELIGVLTEAIVLRGFRWGDLTRCWDNQPGILQPLEVGNGRRSSHMPHRLKSWGSDPRGWGPEAGKGCPRLPAFPSPACASTTQPEWRAGAQTTRGPGVHPRAWSGQVGGGGGAAGGRQPLLPMACHRAAISHPECPPTAARKRAALPAGRGRFAFTVGACSLHPPPLLGGGHLYSALWGPAHAVQPWKLSLLEFPLRNLTSIL